MAEVSVVVPAHNEEQVIGRLLTALYAAAEPGELDVVVVANGCTDGTAAVAKEFRDVRVIETPVPSKAKALQLGDGAAASFPRLYVDGDVEIGTADVRALVEALQAPGVLAAGPVRGLPMDGVPWSVRWYYDVWQRLPGVREELFGRGVVAVNAGGHRQLSELPEVMSDDLAVAMAFDVTERVVVPAATATIRPPRTYRDLLLRRIRAMTGNRQYADLAQSVPSGRRPPRTGVRELVRLAARQPAMAHKVAIFAGTAVLSRVAARRAVRRGDTTWLRDESSRAL